MEYNINIKNWGRIFTVPCSVVDEHIKLASGNAVKVLLCILCSSSNKFNSEVISNQLGIIENEVDDSIAFWQLVEVITCETISVNNYIKIKPMPENVVVMTKVHSTLEAISPNQSNLSKKTSVKYSPKDIEKIVDKSDDLKFLMDNAQVILKRTITFTEQSALINLSEYYGFSVGVILMLFEYCEQLGKASIGYIEAVARSWFEKDITTHEDVEKEIIRLIDNTTFERKVSIAFGLTSKLTPKQKEYINSWMLLNLSLDMIEYAYEICVDSINKFTFPYINKILTNWSENGFKIREQVLSEPKKPKPNSPKEKEHSYDLDEFYKLALNKYSK